MNVLTVFGTRPEAIKMAPLIKALQQEATIRTVVCVTGQHRKMLDQVLRLFDIVPDFDLAVMTHDQSLNTLSAHVLTALDQVLDDLHSDCVVVHGDTTTAMAASVAAFHRRIPIGHVEAGLRTYDLSRPWPEEMNRRVVDAVSNLLFAPTAGAKANLLDEKLGGRVFVTGNTVIDALVATAARIDSDAKLQTLLAARFPYLATDRRLLLVTGHRRESFGGGFAAICAALDRLSRRPDIEIVYPVHLNPHVRDPVLSALAGHQNIHLIEPQDYLSFVYLMRRAHVVLTDSGGVQEEAPSLGKPVLVMRAVTERPEAVAAGTVRLVGTCEDRIVATVSELFDDEAIYRRSAHNMNPYGDGQAAGRIVAALVGRSVCEFTSSAASG
jgi:UDP-N-acetylglucosamine 2-epimerase (non-hydrolysing)